MSARILGSKGLCRQLSSSVRVVYAYQGTNSPSPPGSVDRDTWSLLGSSPLAFDELMAEGVLNFGHKGMIRFG